MTLHPAAGIAIIVVAMLGVLVGLRVLRRRYELPAELSRKGMHVALGLAMLASPFLFASVWPVLPIALATIAVLAAMRTVPWLHERYGGVVGGVERQSGGDFYFPIAAAVLYVITKGDPILFGVPILTLTFADALAAIIGVYYGRFRYRTDDGVSQKSLEGSIAFFTAAFLTTHIPLLLFSDTGRVESLLIGLMFGLLVMLLEAVSLRGTDNLFIPFGGYLLLVTFLERSALALAAMLGVTVTLLIVMLGFRKQRTLTDSAVLTAVLVGFVSWSVGGWLWLVAPMSLFLSYTVLWPRRRLVRRRPHDFVAVMAVVSSGFFWLLLAYVLDRPGFLYPYTISFAANLTFVGITWYRLARRNLHPLTAVARSALTAWAVVFIPYLLTTWRDGDAVIEAAAAVVWLVVGGIAFAYLLPLRRGAQSRPHLWLRQALLGLAASAPGVILVQPGFGSW